MAPPPVIEHLSALENFKVARTYMKQLETVHTLSYKWRWQVTDSLFGRLSYGTGLDTQTSAHRRNAMHKVFRLASLDPTSSIVL